MFTLESEMTSPVRRWLVRSGMHVAEEFATGWGICDLVGCSFDRSKVAYRTEQGQRQPLGSSEAVFIYGLLPDADETRRGVTVETLASRLSPYIEADRIERALRRLLGTNHVRVSRAGAYQKVNGWAPMFSRLVAVELKLNRLGEVLEQARANQTMVPESIVALPADLAQRALEMPFVDELREAGIGLLAVRPSACRLLIGARPSEERLDSLSLWACEYFWRLYRGKH